MLKGAFVIFLSLITMKQNHVTSSKPHVDFKNIVSHLSFIDKTNFVKTVLNYHVLCVQAPSGFGKTTIISMLEKFFQINVDAKGVRIDKIKSDNYNLFSEKNAHTHQDLSVFKDKQFFGKHFGEYPVVKMDLATLDIYPWDGSVVTVASGLCKLVRSAYRQHAYLQHSIRISSGLKFAFVNVSMITAKSMCDVSNLMKNLFSALKTHFNKKIVILVDNMDAPISKIMLSKSSCNEDAIELFSKSFGHFLELLLKPKTTFEFAFLTGISQYDGFFPSSEKQIEYKSIFLHKEFAPYFGLTEEETRSLTQRYQQESKFKLIKAQYDGYKVKGSNFSLFSLTSVVRSLETKALASFWADAGFVSALSRVFRFENMGEMIWHIVRSQSCTIPAESAIQAREMRLMRRMVVADSREDFDGHRTLMLRYLFENGYLALSDNSNEDTNAAITVPNEEVMQVFEKAIWNAARDKHKSLPERVEEVAVALESMKKDERNCQTVVNKAALLVKTLGEETEENEVIICLFTGIRYGIERADDTAKQQKKPTRLQVIGGWDILRDKKGESDLILLLENSSAREGKSYTAFVLRIRFRDDKPIKSLIRILSLDWKRAFRKKEQEEGSYNITDYVYVGMHVDEESLLVSASVLLGGRESSHAINVTAQSPSSM